MSVNDGVLNSSVSFSQIQSFYGGSNPISLSEYYRGGSEVPSTSLSGANPYVSPTSFSGSGSGSGGSSGIGVAVSNQDTTSGGGTLGLTNVGYNSARGYYTYTWNAPAGGATIDITLNGRQNSGSFNPGVLNTQAGLFNITRSFTQGRFENGRTNFNIDNITFIRTLRIGASGGLNATYRFQGNVPAGFGLVSIGATLRNEFNPPVILVSNNSTIASTTVSRRRAIFTNNTGQRITLNITFMGGNSRSATLERGQTIDTGIINGSNEAWTFNYSYNDAGSGSGSADATVAGIFADVQARQVVTTNPNASTATLTGSGQSVSAVNIPAGDVDFTLSATPRSDDNLNVLFATGSIDRSGLTLTTNAPVPFRVGDGSPASGLGPGRSGYFDFNFSNRGVGNTFTLRVTGTISTARTWNGFAGNIGGAPAHANGVITLVNNEQSSTSTVQDIFFTNNTGENVILSPASTGGTRTMSNGQRDQVQTGGTSTNWSFQYRYAPSTQPANTAIPQSGTINTNQFNSPGNAAS